MPDPHLLFWKRRDMLLGPVFRAEMITTARRKRYVLVRVLFASFLLFLLWTNYSAVRGYRGGSLAIADVANLTAIFFQTFSWFTLFGALLVTPAVAAGTIATERERRTIEYLFATDLSNSEIVLAKMFSKLLLMGQLLLTALPVLAIFRLMGGIPGNLLLAFFAIMASTITMLVAASMCVSVWTPRARDAVLRVYLLVFVLLLLPLPVMSLASLFTNRWVVEWLLKAGRFFSSFNPIAGYGSAVGIFGGPLGGALDWWQVGRLVTTQLLISAVLAIVAVVAVRRVHLRAQSGGDRLRRRERVRRRKRPEIGERPMLWKEIYARTAATKVGGLGKAALWLIGLSVVGIACLSFYHAVYQRSSWRNPWEEFAETSIAITVVVGSALVLLMGLRAAGLVSYEKERDTWLSLISAPLSGREILLAKTLGNFYAFRWAILPLAWVWLLQAVLKPSYLIVAAFSLLAMLLSAAFATQLGLCFSLRWSTTLKSLGATVGTLLFVGGGYTIFCACCLIGSNVGDEAVVVFGAVIPFLIAIPSILFVSSGNEAEIVIPYLLGCIGYGAAAGIMFATLVERFDHIVGRTSIDSPAPGRPTPLSSHSLQPES